MTRVRVLAVLLILLLFPVYASDISFSGGRTSVRMEGDLARITLTQDAHVLSDDISVSSDEISIHGKDYSLIDCVSNVKVISKGLEISCTNLFYDRNDNIITSRGWIEISDTDNEVLLSAASLSYLMEDEKITLAVMAGLTKDTSQGLLVCSSDILSYSVKDQTLILRGNAQVSWGSDYYSAQIIEIDIARHEITMHGAITGVLNGK